MNIQFCPVCEGLGFTNLTHRGHLALVGEHSQPCVPCHGTGKIEHVLLGAIPRHESVRIVVLFLDGTVAEKSVPRRLARKRLVTGREDRPENVTLELHHIDPDGTLHYEELA